MTDGKFLNWMVGRLINVYGEDENTDFVLRLKAIADKSVGVVEVNGVDIDHHDAEKAHGIGNFGVLAATLYKIQELLAQPEQEPTNHMHEIFLHNLQNKEKLGEMIINLDDQYITLLGHKVVITEIIDREAYPVVGYFIDLNNDGEPRINETEWDKNGDSAYCLDWRWGLTLDTSPNPGQEVFTNTRGFLTDLKRLLKSELSSGDAIDWIDAYLDKTCDFIYDETF